MGDKPARIRTVLGVDFGTWGPSPPRRTAYPPRHIFPLPFVRGTHSWKPSHADRDVELSCSLPAIMKQTQTYLFNYKDLQKNEKHLFH